MKSRKLLSAIESMNPDTLHYKRLFSEHTQILSWLRLP